MEWAENLDDKGRMWATPGPYLRRLILQNLAHFVSHEFLPEELVEGNTFTKAPSCPSRNEEAEETLVISLSIRIKDVEIIGWRRGQRLFCCDGMGVRIVIHPSGRDKGRNRKSSRRRETKKGKAVGVHRSEGIDCA